MSNKVVLGFSGGLDTSFCVKWLQEQGMEPICVTLDIGQDANLDDVRLIADKLGVQTLKIIDGKENFVNFFLIPALKANALYQGVYPLATALGRPYIGKVIADTARELGTNYVAHGCTGKGNDQIRIELAINAIIPDANIIDPIRDNNYSRDYEIEYLQKHGIDLGLTKEKPYSIDQNLWGRSVCAGMIEDISVMPPQEVYQWTTALEECPNNADEITVEFVSGMPVALNGERLSTLEIILRLNDLGGKHGVGRIDHIEDRLVGIKSREIYEAPAAVILIRAHQVLESLTLSKASLDFKTLVEKEYARIIYLGEWFSPHHLDLVNFLYHNQLNVSGVIGLKLFKGNCIVSSRASSLALYDKLLATYSSDSVFDQRSATGFIKFIGMASRIQIKAQKLGYEKEMSHLLESTTENSGEML